MKLQFLSKYKNIGLLVLRIGIGSMFILHGGPKMFGGPDKWLKIGKAMTSVGIDFVPQFWGFMASFSELFGGICIILGLFFRPACILLTMTMIVASAMHLGRGDTIIKSSHAIEAGFLFFGLIFIGPGKFSIDEKHSQ